MIMRLLTIPVILILVTVLNAQEIPGPGFENWPGTNNNSPQGWLANNPAVGPTTVFASLNAHSGMFSAALRVLDISGFPVPPTLAAGVDGTGFPVTQRYEALNGWFEFTPVTGEFFDVLVSMWMGGPGGTLIGAGNFSTSNGTTNWTQFYAPINYNDPGTPDWCSVVIIIGITVASTGGQAVVDDLSFGSASSVEPINKGIVPDEFKLTQNYPNPFNPTTKIEYSIPEGSFVKLKIYDVLGNEVETLVSEEQAAGVYRDDFNAVGLTSGFYIARISAGNYSDVIKMTLMK